MEKQEDPKERAKRLGIEPQAVSEIFCCWMGRDKPYGVNEGEVETSKAISAKRQADALERIAQHMETMAGEMAHPEWGIAPTLRDLGRGR